MPTATDRIRNVNSSRAVKVPCRVATTANISLSGLQVIDGIQLVEYDRVLVKNQTAGAENGIYEAGSGAWLRAPDFDSSYDVGRGTMVNVFAGTVSGGLFFKVANATDPVIGTDAITWASTNLPLSSTFVTGDAYGVDYSGVTASDAALAAALGSGREVRLGHGTITLAAPLKLDGDNASLVGMGPAGTIIQATHSDGAVIHIEDYYCRLARVGITSSAARKAGSAGVNYGLLISPEDVFGQHVHDTMLEQVRVYDQPSHGVVSSGSVFGLGALHCRVENNLGHAVVVDNGTLRGYTNIGAPGGFVWEGGHILDNVGHAFLIGNNDGTVNYCVRMQFINVDTYRNALAAGVRKSAHAWWMYMGDSSVVGCGFGCADGSNVPQVAPFYLIGRDNMVPQPRFIRPTVGATIDNYAGDGISSVGNEVTKITVSNPASNLDPAVIVADEVAAENKVTCERTTFVDSAMTPVDRSEWQYGDQIYHHQDHHFKSIDSGKARTLADDGFTTIEFDADPTWGLIHIVGNTPSTRGEALVSFRVGSSPEVRLIDGQNVSVGTGALTTGTSDGVDTDLNIQAHTDNKLYIKNRTGGSGIYVFSLLSVGGGSILPDEMEKVA